MSSPIVKNLIGFNCQIIAKKLSIYSIDLLLAKNELFYYIRRIFFKIEYNCVPLNLCW